MNYKLMSSHLWQRVLSDLNCIKQIQYYTANAVLMMFKYKVTTAGILYVTCMTGDYIFAPQNMQSSLPVEPIHYSTFHYRYCYGLLRAHKGPHQSHLAVSEHGNVFVLYPSTIFFSLYLYHQILLLSTSTSLLHKPYLQPFDAHGVSTLACLYPLNKSMCDQSPIKCNYFQPNM